MTHIRNVYAHFPVAVFQLLQTQGVVKILGICWVNGKGGYCSKIAAVLCNLFFFNGSVQRISFLFYLFRELIRQPKFCQNCMNLCVVFSGITKHFDDLAKGRTGLLGPIHNAGDGLLSVLYAIELLLWNEDVDEHFSRRRH